MCGVIMARYLTQHTLACLTRQGAENLAQRMQAGGLAHAERVLVNMLEGKMFVEFRADSREVLEAWLKTEGMHFDWLVRVSHSMRTSQSKCMPSVLSQASRTSRESARNSTNIFPSSMLTSTRSAQAVPPACILCARASAPWRVRQASVCCVR